MARSYAKVYTSIWSDEDFKSLPPDLQHTYFVLMSQPRLSMCGLLDFIPSRLARCSDVLTVDDVELRVKGLESKSYVVVDHETHELLIRSFIRNDEVLLSPNLTVAAIRDYAEVMSEKLRRTIENELARAWREAPDLKGWAKVHEGNPVLMKLIERRAREGAR